jgi:hypothetical protein
LKLKKSVLTGQPKCQIALEKQHIGNEADVIHRIDRFKDKKEKGNE